MKHIIDLLEIPPEQLKVMQEDPVVKDIVNNYNRSRMVWWKSIFRGLYDMVM